MAHDVIHSHTAFDAKRRLYQPPKSECRSLIDLLHEEVDSSFFEEEDDGLYDFMNLRPKPGKCLSEYNDDDQDKIDIFEAPPRFAVEYEDCNEANNRSHCVGGEDGDKDTGLDSTMSFSIKDYGHLKKGDRALSHRGSG